MSLLVNSWRASLFSAAALNALISQIAVAQQVPAQDSQQSEVAQSPAEAPDEGIVVTGSRIARRDLVANSPIVTMTAAQLQNNSSPTIEASLQQLPQFQPNPPSAARATLNLRNLGPNRNLVLLDGRRMQPSAADFSVDVNSLPASIIENVEVISGGASAVYGSDAISGVINFKLRRRFEGLELAGQAGITDAQDGESYNINAIVGGNFADDRGNAFFAADYTSRKAAYNADRGFYENAYRAGTGSLFAFLPQGYYKATSNSPTQGAIDAYFGSVDPRYTAGGVLPNALFAFNQDASLFDQSGRLVYNLKNGPEFPRTTLVTRPTGQSLFYNGGSELYLQTPLERYAIFGRAEYDVSEAITAFAQGSFTTVTTRGLVNPSNADNFWLVTVPRDAAHPIPDSLASLLDSRANPAASWQYGRQVSFMGPIQTTTQTDVFQVLAGLKGQIPGLDWTWEVYGQHGRTSVLAEIVDGGTRFSRLQELMAAPFYGRNYVSPSAGRLVCTTGIVPFGESNSRLASPTDGSSVTVGGTTFSRQISNDCIEYLSAYTKNTTELEQDVVEANLQGRLLGLPAGDVRFAAGLGYRKNTYQFVPDALFDTKADTSSDVLNNFGATKTAGDTDVREAFGELLIPVLKDLPFIRSLELDLAGRYSDYKQAGGVWAYKADANWQVFDALMLRGGYQRAVRAPNVNELFAPQTTVLSTGASAFDPCMANAPVSYGNNAANANRAQVQALCRALIPASVPYDPATYAGPGVPTLVGSSQGNPNLVPEKADTFTFGAVFRPGWHLPLDARLTATVDYYNISIDGVIGVLTPLESYQLCFNQNGASNPTYSATNAYCAPIIRAPSNGFPSNVQNVFQNLGGLKTSGIDAQIDLSVAAFGGRLSLNSVLSYLDSYKRAVNPATPFIELANTTGGYFQFRSTTNLTFAKAGSLAGLRWRHYDSVHDVSYATNPNTTVRGVPSYNIFDLFGSFHVGDGVLIRLGVDNMFNKSPEFIGLAATQTANGFTDASFYDVLGRRYYVGAKFNF